MTNIEQVIAQIRFQLDQLSARNAQHDFEHLCRHLTRARICSNILPATGPVAAGGDQGRDFETFVTYLRSSPIANTTFVGKISQKPVVFPCSIQRRGISSKIKSDLDTIMKSGSPVEAIHYFCTSNVPVSTRHALKDWARNSYSIHLEVHDGKSISELLADREVFWIAQQFLSIPSEIYPRAADEESWYIKSLDTWKANKTPFINYADFQEIRAATRHATFSPNTRQDLPFWINLLKRFIDESWPQLKRKAIYEIAVASLRGLETLIGQEDYIKGYFSSISGLDDPTDLEDASALLNYCIDAAVQSKVQLSKDELGSWQDSLLDKVEERLKVAETAGLICSSLEIRGYLCLSIDPRQPDHIDAEGAIRYWAQLVRVAKDAPLFPLERFDDHLTKYIGFIGESQGFDQITQQVDLLLSQRHGNFKAAEKCRDRAIEFYKKGKIIKALNQLHQAKVKWFAQETLRSSLLSVLSISEMYKELGLSFAAKYYALAAAHVTVHSLKSDVKPLLPRALIAAAECDYYQGAWCGFLELTDIGLRTYAWFSKQANKEEIDGYQRTVFHIAVLMAIVNRLDPQLLKFVEGWVQEWKLDDLLEELLLKTNETWGKQSLAEIWTSLNQQLGGPLFSDLGAVRKVSWAELGITWSANWKNDYATNPAAEQLIAILQVLLADLAGIDLCLLKTHVSIDVSVENITKPKVESIPSNKGRKWKVTLPIYSEKGDRAEFERMSIDTLAVASSILAEVSLLPSERFYEVLENCFKNGISMKVFVSRPYEVIYREFITRDVFERSARPAKTSPESSREFEIKEHRELAWVDGPGPGYSKDKANEYLRNRYSRSIIPIKYTLKRLLKSSEFRSTVNQLRADGWLDWHILTAIASVATNYRVVQFPEARYSPDIQANLFQEMMTKPESENAFPVPLKEFTVENLRRTQNIGMISTLRVHGLECHQTTPDFESIDHFLRYRYNYWNDDIPHSDPFQHS